MQSSEDEHETSADSHGIWRIISDQFSGAWIEQH